MPAYSMVEREKIVLSLSVPYAWSIFQTFGETQPEIVWSVVSKSIVPGNINGRIAWRLK